MIVTTSEFNLLCSHKDNDAFILRVDFGTKEVTAKVEGDYAVLDGRYTISLKTRVKSNFCYLVKKKNLLPIAFFAKDTNRFYKLLPTGDWPTVTLGSVPMHRIHGLSPEIDTQNKINLLKPYGIALDTCMGLGYTAIAAAYLSKMVYTFEADKNVYFMAQLNPCSRELFSRKNIIIKKGDVAGCIKKFTAGFFDCIIHDPPTFKIAPFLYSEKFYQELYRVLKDNGKLFHYTPFYGAKRGKDFPHKVKIKLKATGFKVLLFNPARGGIVCRKI